MAVELAFQFREDFGDGLGRARAGGYQRLTTGARPAQILVALVHDGQGVGDIVNGSHAST